MSYYCMLSHLDVQLCHVANASLMIKLKIIVISEKKLNRCVDTKWHDIYTL